MRLAPLSAAVPAGAHEVGLTVRNGARVRHGRTRRVRAHQFRRVRVDKIELGREHGLDRLSSGLLAPRPTCSVSPDCASVAVDEISQIRSHLRGVAGVIHSGQFGFGDPGQRSWSGDQRLGGLP